MNKCCEVNEHYFYPFEGGCEIKCWHCGFAVFGSSYKEAVRKWQSARQSMHLTAFGARLAWLFFGFILLQAMVLVIIASR